MMKLHNLRKSIGVNCSSRRRASDIFHPTRTHWFKICILKFFFLPLFSLINDCIIWWKKIWHSFEHLSVNDLVCGKLWWSIWICQEHTNGFPTNQSYICHSWFRLNSVFFEAPCMFSIIVSYQNEHLENIIVYCWHFPHPAPALHWWQKIVPKWPQKPKIKNHLKSCSKKIIAQNKCLFHH